MRRILMIAYHFPPSHGSSGIHRTVKFSRYLPEYGWQPTVLTVHPRAHPSVAAMDLPENVLVERASAFDTARHFAVKGRYPRWLAFPDRWISWYPPAVIRGLSIVRRFRPHVIWSTFPIATAHLIALTLHRLTGIPWIADFRDPMTETDPATGIEYPLDPAVRRVFGWIERPTVKYCTRAVLTTPTTTAMYASRFASIPADRWVTIANGYDEEDFAAAEAIAAPRVRNGKPLVLVHSGVLYPDSRDPRAFFAALGHLKSAGEVAAASLRIVLRASGREVYYTKLIREHDIEDIVFLEPAISHREALAEMLTADGLLIFQAASCNWQIPAKLYECLRARRPILALADPLGDTADVLRSAGVDTLLPLNDEVGIRRGLIDFLARVRTNEAPVARPEIISKHSRRSRTRELAAVLDEVVPEGSAVLRRA